MRVTGVIISFFICCALPSIFCDDYIVEVKQGQLAGLLEKDITGDYDFYSFRGIPYAKPPVGKLRFKAPQEADSWSGVRDASQHGNVCPQFNPISNQYNYGSEDCLFLNVYTPTLNTTESLPVLVYIHGGAYLFGDGNDNLYRPDFLVSKDVVVVTLNYRLETLGFLSLGTEEVPGNAALKDQVLALKWVQENIAKFGGNPKEVTILGGTAGGSSVAYHIISPMAKGLFKRAISMSGAPSCDWASTYHPEERGFQLAKMLRGDEKEITDKTELLEYLQGVPPEQLINVQPRVLASEKVRNVLFKMEYFTPIIEIDFGKNENFITKDPFKSLTKEDVNDVEVMFSYNGQEALLLVDLYNASLISQYYTYDEMFVPDKLAHNILPSQNLEIAEEIVKYYFGDKKVSNENIAEFINYASFASINYDVQRFFRKISKFVKSYFFKFSYFTSRNVYGSAGSKYGLGQTSHFDEVFYLFHSKDLNLPVDKNSKEYELIQTITTAITNFAKYGNPSPSESSIGITWSEYNTDTKYYVDFTNDALVVGQDADGKDIDFWESIFTRVGIKF
ncbi:esterase B1-like [Trichoplusia ni]|uniref:Esterase B1-like n=1 Tax=Trichoplusia ni TaxID=7111 RepID=A0A7E5WWQ9_TRINI|nr:esterase B1-like [Trichoplusia ni]